MIPRSSLWDRLFRRERQGWLKFAGAVGFMAIIGFNLGLRMLKERPEVAGAAAAGVLTGATIFAAFLGAILGAMFVARDAVMSRLNRGKHVNGVLRLFLGPGIISLLSVSLAACAIILPLLVVLLDSKSLPGPRTVANGASTDIHAPPPPPSPLPSSTQSLAPDAPAGVPRPAFESQSDSSAPPVKPIDNQRPPKLANDPLASFPEEPRIESVVRPMHIGAEVPPKEAYAQFVERYGAERVARVIVRMESEQQSAELQLQGDLMRSASSEQPPSIYVSTKGLTLAGIVAPVDSIETFAQKLSLGKVTQVQKESRIVSAIWADEPRGLESKLHSPRTTSVPAREPQLSQGTDDDLSQLVAQLDRADLRQRDEFCAAIAALKTPQAAEALAARLGGSAYFAASDALKTMGEVAYDSILAQAESSDFAISSRAFNVLSDIGTKELLPKLQRLARHQDRRIAIQAEATLRRIQRQP